MNEVLYLRLASQADSPFYWLIWSNSSQEIIASGQLSHADELATLTDKAHQRQVVAIVPSADVALKSLKVPGKSQRAVKLAAPYMLEDSLAQEVEQTFFAFADHKEDETGNNCFVAVIEKEQMQRWLAWLKQANIQCQKMLPEVLALPEAREHWQSVVIDKQLIIRQGLWQGAAIEQNVLPLALSHWQADEQIVIDSYSSLESFPDLDSTEVVAINAEPEELPLALFAQQKLPSFNLLQGEFKVTTKRSPALKYWLMAASLAGIALVLNLGLKIADYYQVTNQQAQVEQAIVTTYKKAFPQSKKVRVATIRSLLKQKMVELGQNSEQAGFLVMLSQLQTAFEQVPQLKPTSLRFDGKRQEIRIQAQASDYQSFDKFKQVLEQSRLEVAQGAQNNQGDLVTGSLSIRGRS